MGRDRYVSTFKEENLGAQLQPAGYLARCDSILDGRARAAMPAKGTDLDIRAARGNRPTVLMAAADAGKLDRVRELLALGARSGRGRRPGRGAGATRIVPRQLPGQRVRTVSRSRPGSRR
ncbi:hypothetical protein DFR24_1380 [Panacagrimonas perspica]|uniref:Ankyrin repeat protein n=1 Tax=Panacagrimonas perspica TaxID=381431 RepID=A0A4R7PCX5_9GAMM|nr:hypothetical protein [Panacagrimonas perspica]TDU31995.1 hypothetical protein DFR24_1380 [Panacagrimonas perspica]THD04468.1 hypothetical protein B1810_05570 [Panacagrimonas perspica]